MKPLKTLSLAIVNDVYNFKFYSILIFIGGCLFAISYRQNCSEFLVLLSIIFGILIIAYSLDNISFRRNFYGGNLVFLIGIFYVIFYHNYFLKNTLYHQKLYVAGQGKIIETKNFLNPLNQNRGINLKVQVNKLLKLEFDKNKSPKKIDTIKKSPKKLKKVKKKSPKNKAKNKIKSSKKQASKLHRQTLKQKAFAKKIYKKFINLKNYQELDRQFLDAKNNIYFDDWIEVPEGLAPRFIPQVLYLTYAKNSTNYNGFDINDEIAFKAVIEPIDKPDFKNNFNRELDALGKNIDGFGFIISTPNIVHKELINNFDALFLDWREKIRQKIAKYLNQENGAIALALIIGEQNNIGKNLLNAIRNSGLSHLLSISGFHLSLACAIFFIGLRNIMARIEFIALRVDVKKISAIFAIFASYLYYKIANAPLPSQRALIVVWMMMLSLLIDRKFDGIRALFTALLVLILINPYNLIQVSFQLSFVGVLITICYALNWRLAIFPQANLQAENKFITGVLSNIKQYLADIFIITFVIQIACLPILMNSFQSFSLVAFIANLFVIPLVSFLIMPCAFLALITMIIGLEKIPLMLLNELIKLFVESVNFFAKFKYAIISTPYISGFSTYFGTMAIIIFALTKNIVLRFVAIMIFILSIYAGIKTHRPQIIFEKNQKFYAIFDQRTLYFSKKVSQTKQIKNWLKSYNNKDIKLIKSCQKIYNNNLTNCQKCSKNYCEIFFKNRRILVLKGRNKISHICRKIKLNKYYAIVNLTKKYKLPECIMQSRDVKIIDNIDFLAQQTIIVD